jgi:hypothetical protein
VPDPAQAFERGVQDRARGPAANVGDEADATGVAFFTRREQVEPPSGDGENPPTAIDLAGGGGERNAG